MMITAGMFLLGSVVGCKRKHVPAESVPELGYPSCAGSATKAITEKKMFSGPNDMRQPIVESYHIEDRGCMFAIKVRQEWPKQISDIEVLFDKSWLPLRVWRRYTIPGSSEKNGHAEIKRLELRTPEVTIKHKSAKNEIAYEVLKGGKPVAVIGPGRGLLTAWIQRSHLQPGQKVRELVLDFRAIEVIRPVTLARMPDRFEKSLKRKVRVYTIYGREAVFADENDHVLGDLQGMTLVSVYNIPLPPPMSTFEPIDPVHTP
jgi:hypothetical protein